MSKKERKNINYENLKKFKENLDKDIIKHITLTQLEYDSLTTEQKNNGAIYFITDGIANISESDIDYINNQADKTKLDSLSGIILYKSGSIAINQSLQIDLPKECYYIVVLKSGNPPHGIWLVDNVISYVGYSDVKQLAGYGDSSDPIVRKVNGSTGTGGEGMNGFVIQGCSHSPTTYKIYELPF